MILQPCYAPRIARETMVLIQHIDGGDNLSAELDNLYPVGRVTIPDHDIEALRASICRYAGQPGLALTGFVDDDDFEDWPEEHRFIVPFLSSPESFGLLDNRECERVWKWLSDHRNSVDEGEVAARLFVVVSAAVDCNGGLVIS